VAATATIQASATAMVTSRLRIMGGGCHRLVLSLCRIGPSSDDAA
jgi:hypothetical protein